MRLTKRVLKALTGPKDAFQIAAECGKRYRVQDVLSVLINLERDDLVVQSGQCWTKTEIEYVPPEAAWPMPKPVNSVFALGAN